MPGPIDIGATMSSGFAALAAGLSSLGFTGGKPQQQQSQQQQGTRKSHSQVPAKTLSQQHARKSEDTDTHTHTQHPRPSSRPPSRPASEVPSPPPLLAAPEKAHVKGEQLQQHTQRMEGEGEGDLFSPNDVRDPLADEVRELYAKIRQGKGSASPGGQKQDGTGEGKEEQRDDKQRNGSAQSHSQSGEGGRDEIAAPKQQPEIVPEREPGVDVDDSATATATGETVNPLLDPLLGEEAVDMTPRRRW
ncbi:hypothetical protein KEM55_000347 [Ascosphaera atra]|nr:hypothetical protein KEM55_000347 [Ascosphaera atra]